MQIASSPVYLDTSALAKIYVPERGSVELESALVGRRDLIVSDLVITEFTSAVARRAREGELSERLATRLYDRLLLDIAAGEYRRADLTPNAHREAERLLMGLGRRLPLRAADALHLALAARLEARVFVTFDRQMKAAAAAIGTFELPA